MVRPARTLARFGLPDSAAVRGDLAAIGLEVAGPAAAADPEREALLVALSRAPRPELALRQLGRLVVALRSGAAEGKDGGGAGGTGAGGADGTNATETAYAVTDPAAGLLRALRTDPSARASLLGLLGGSEPLGEHLVAHPADWTALVEPASFADLTAPERCAAALAAAMRGPDGRPLGVREAIGPLRAAYRTRLAIIAAADLAPSIDPGAAGPGLGAVCEALTVLADALMAAALELARAAHPATDGRGPVRLAVVAMGKCGARELNYVSDVDVLFVTDGGGEGEAAMLVTATAQAGELMRICGQVAWEVDAGLRPEGGAGPLVRTLDGYASYYRRWAKTWEFQALLKARPAAGDVDLGERFVGMTAPLVWSAAERDSFVADVQAMRRRVEDAVPVADRDRDLKLAAGGLRDVEFAVQLLQLVHGRADESLRVPGTLAALRALIDGGYVGRQDGAELAEAYAFQRRVEHLMQLQHLRRTHSVPATAGDREWLARAVGLAASGTAGAAAVPVAGSAAGAAAGGSDAGGASDAGAGPDPSGAAGGAAGAVGTVAGGSTGGAAGAASGTGGGDAAARLAAELSRHATAVRRLHEKLFYRPLLTAVAAVPTDELRLSPEAAESRLAALGFAAPKPALAHIAALTDGVSRRAAIQRTLLPVLLGTLADSPDPDAGLLAYRQVSDALAGTPWYLRLLRDEGLVAQRLVALLGTSRLVAELLQRAPEVLRLLVHDEDLTGSDPAAASAVAASALLARADRAGDAVAAAGAARSARRHEMLRLACADLLGVADLAVVTDGLTRVADAAVQAAVRAAERQITEERAAAADGQPAEGQPAVAPGTRGRRPVLAGTLAVVAMGRFGGGEMGYSSDADVLFVAGPTHPGADPQQVVADATAIAELATRLLDRPSPDPPLRIDADLRPDGRAGPLVRTVASYEQYWQRRAEPWERQALLRARPVAGDEELGAAFLRAVDAVRYPPEGLGGGDVREIRRIKARVDTERLPRGADPALHTKLGRGGLADVEWTIQLLQLQHAGKVPSVRRVGTLAAIRAASDADLLAPADAAALIEGWTAATRARNAIMLVTGKAGDEIPPHGRVLAGIARACGYPAHADPGQFVDDYRRATRRARRVVDRLFDRD